MSDFLNLNNSIKLEIINTNIVIEDLDIDFEIELTNEQKPNEAKVTIWNLSDNTRNALLDEATGVRIYYQEGDEPYRLIFEGQKKNRLQYRKSKAKKHKKGWKPKAKIIRNYDINEDGADYSLTLELTESYTNYYNSYFSKSYRTEVTAQQIMADVASSMNMGCKISGSVNNKTYKNGITFFGHSRHIMNQLCDSVGSKWHSSQGIVTIGSVSEKQQPTVFEFNSRNIGIPEFHDKDEILIKTKLITYIRPDDWIYVDVNEIDAKTYRVCKIKHKGSNYSEENETEITFKDK